MPADEKNGLTVKQVIEKLSSGLDEVQPRNMAERMELVKAKAAIGLLLEGGETMIKMGYRGQANRPENILDWLYKVAYRELVEFIQEQVNQPSPITGQKPKHGAAIVHFPFKSKAGEMPKMVFTRGNLDIDQQGQYTLTPAQSFQPHSLFENALQWYNSRQSPTDDFSRLWLSMQQEETDQQQPTK